MGHDHHGFAFDLGVPVSHCGGRLFMTAREQLRGFVAAIVDNRFVQRAECRSGVGGGVLKAERLENLQHEVRTRPIRGIHIHARRRRTGFCSDQAGTGQRCYGPCLRRLRGRCSLCQRNTRTNSRPDQCGGSGCGAFQESAAINRTFFGARHGANSPLLGCEHST